MVNNPSYSYSLWDWTPLEEYSDSKILSNITTTLEVLNIRRIYLSINDLVDIQELPEGKEKENKKSIYFNFLNKYIKVANSKGIEVEALAGDKKWSDPDYRYLTIIAIELVKEYNIKNNQNIKGIQFDIEPEFDDISTTQKEILINNYLDTVNDLRKNLESSNSNLTLGFAIPYWYDGENQNIPQVQYHGKEGYPAFHIIDILSSYHQSYIVLMSYRNQATGIDGTIIHSQAELEYAELNTPSIKVYIGQELNNVEPSKITFYGKKTSDLTIETLKINTYFNEHKTFGGIAIHDMQGLLDLKR